MSDTDQLGQTEDLLPDCWFHGTPRTRVRFTEWIIPPPVTSDEGIGRHSAVFLARDRDWASLPGDKLVCRTRFKSNSRIVDLQSDRGASEAVRERLLSIERGTPWRHTAQLRSRELWQTSWENGSAMRFQPSGFQRERSTKLQLAADRAIQNASAKLPTQVSDLKAVRFIMTQMRALTEAICVAVSDLGYDAMIGKEPGKSYEGPATPRVIAAVFNPNVLTSPVWE